MSVCVCACVCILEHCLALSCGACFGFCWCAKFYFILYFIFLLGLWMFGLRTNLLSVADVLVGCVPAYACIRSHVDVSVLKSPFDFTQRTHWRCRRLRLLRLLLLHHHFLTLALSFPLLSFPLYICIVAAAVVAAAYVHEQMQATIRCLYIFLHELVLFSLVSFHSFQFHRSLLIVIVVVVHVRWTTRMPTTNINIAYTTRISRICR